MSIMKKKNKIRVKNRRLWLRSCVFSLAVLLCAGFIAVSAPRVAAFTSLPYIETIINEKSIYNILEIIPERGSGSLGYYADGSEPCGMWTEDIKAIESRSGRTSYVNTLFADLIAAKLLGSDTTTAMTLKYARNAAGDYYEEIYPWEYTALADIDKIDWTAISLLSAEVYNAAGTFTAAENGAFEAQYESSINPDGDYIQKKDNFELVDDGDGSYYYNFTFEQLDLNLLEEYFNKPVYQKILNDDETESEYYAFRGYLGTTVTVNADETYYVRTAATAPSAVYDAENYPYAVKKINRLDGFEKVAAGEGDFNLTIERYKYVGQGGDFGFEPVAGGQARPVNYDTVYCKSGFTNNDFFLKEVFDRVPDAAGNISDDIRVVVNAKTAAEVEIGDINRADMIVLSAGFVPGSPASQLISSYGAGNDLSADEAFAVYAFVCSDYPVIVDYRLSEAYGGAAGVNLFKLARLCSQKTKTIPEGTTTFGALSISEQDSDSDGFYVNKSVFSFRPVEIAAGITPAALATPYLAYDFYSESDNVYDAGFEAVISEIIRENNDRDTYGVAALPEEITVANAIRYIINFHGQRTASIKSKVTVLEIQPLATDSGLSKDTVRDWLGRSVDYTDDEIKIVTMTTGEFVGKIEDLNETYDLIYIGASTDSFNMKDGKTNFNDDSMDGLIYMNIGDTYVATALMAGLLGRDYIIPSGGDDPGIDSTTGNKTNTFRFSGNDITAAKVTELENYIKAGYPLVVADELMSADGSRVNTVHVDNSSYMYRALDLLKGKKSFWRASETSGLYSGAVINDVQSSKPSIVFKDETCYPVVYRVNDDGSTTSMANNKNHYLTYTFTIENQTDPTPSETVYNVKLYIDLNADGRYADTEALDNIDVFDSNGVLLSPDSMYRLSAGMEYKVQRLLPDSYVGIIPWKLEVTKIGAEHIHASANNYSRIAAVNKQTIKILQIAPSNRSGTELNLQEQLKADTVNRYSQLLGSDGVTYYKGIYGKLIADLEDFDVDITTIEADDLERKGSDDEIFSYLDGYEMLIIGFADMYGEIESNTAAAITQFIDTQKSVLFTHDTTSLSNVSNRNILQIKDENLGDSENIVFLQPWQRSSTNFITVTNNSNTNYSSLTIDYNSKKYELQWVKRGKRWEQVWVLVSESDTEQYAYQEMTLAPGHYTVQCTLNSDSALTLDIGVCENYRVNNPINRMPNIEAASAPKTCTFTFEITGNVSRNVQLYIKQASVDNNGKVYVTSMTVKKNAKAASKLFYSGCDPSYWGYYFNTVIRDSVGLDRYGITSSSLKSFLFDSNVLTSPADDSLIGRILSNNRSVAYMPGSAATKTVPEVQGFTNYSLIRYGSASSLKYTNNDYSERTTTTVSQVNEGQITTYPYNINTAAFDGRIGSGSYMRVGLTHEQYYQLNMNTDDIVVWYCLSGGAAVSDNTNYVSASNGWTYTANGNKLSPTFDNRSVDSRIYFNGNYANKIPAGTYTLTCRLRNDSRAQSAQIGVEGNGIAGKVYEQYNYTNGGYTDVSFTFTVTNTTQSFSLFFWWEGYNSRNSAKCLFQNISIKAAKSASYYNDSPNDVVNSYYIYTKGNVTYSGVGHSSANSNYTGNNIGEQYINEAKLFVNTMIAAYQAAGQVPTVSIKRSQTSSADLDSKYFVTENVSDGEETAPDEDTLLEQKLGRRESYAVYFKISDPNLTTDKTISVSFYCMPKTVIGEDGVDEVDENGFIKLTGEAYIASTDSEADQENLTGGVVYKLYVCDLKYTDNNGNTVSLDKLLAQKNISSIDLYVQICTTIGKQPLIGDDYISLRKVGLFELS